MQIDTTKMERWEAAYKMAATQSIFSRTLFVDILEAGRFGGLRSLGSAESSDESASFHLKGQLLNELQEQEHVS